LRRVVTVIIATLGGLALLASFHTSPGVVTKTVTRAAGAGRPPAGGSPPTTPSTGAPSGSSVPGNNAPSSTAPASTALTIVGPVESNDYGDVQVQIVVRGGRLVDVQALQLPSDRRRSAEISNYAEPYLRQEALQARSANIDIVSGATYTSVSYAQSLQAALDQAGV